MSSPPATPRTPSSPPSPTIERSHARAPGGVGDVDWTTYLRAKSRVTQALRCYGEVTASSDAGSSALSPAARNWKLAGSAAKTMVHAYREAKEGIGYVPKDVAQVLDAAVNEAGLDPLERRVRAFVPACRALPKVELHAHLNGCVRDATLVDLAAQRARERGEPFDADAFRARVLGLVGAPATPLDDDAPRDEPAGYSRSSSSAPRSLSRCFELFGAIHEVCTDHEALRRVAAEAVMDFARDGVAYLELRTTPKDLPSRGVTKESYCEAVLLGMHMGACLATHRLRHDGGGDLESDPAIVARLILSIDRRETAKEAKRTVKLAAYLRDVDCGVVGVDLSGDPTVGAFSKFAPSLALARSNGLPVTLHCGEVKNPAEERQMVAFGADRLGHCVWTTRDADLWRALRDAGTPVEICVTSNVITESIHSLGGDDDDDASRGFPGSFDSDSEDSAAPDGSGGSASRSLARLARRHHLTKFRECGHPFVVCTDDPGVFRTTLSREYALVCAALGLRTEDLKTAAHDAFEHAFIHRAEAMAEGDAEHTAREIASVRRRLARGKAAWRGLPTLNARDAVAETASAVKRRAIESAASARDGVRKFVLEGPAAPVLAPGEGDLVERYDALRRFLEREATRLPARLRQLAKPGRGRLVGKTRRAQIRDGVRGAVGAVATLAPIGAVALCASLGNWPMEPATRARILAVALAHFDALSKGARLLRVHLLRAVDGAAPTLDGLARLAETHAAVFRAAATAALKAAWGSAERLPRVGDEGGSGGARVFFFGGVAPSLARLARIAAVHASAFAEASASVRDVVVEGARGVPGARTIANGLAGLVGGGGGGGLGGGGGGGGRGRRAAAAAAGRWSCASSGRSRPGRRRGRRGTASRAASRGAGGGE